ncbi:MAG: hypothetical protein QOK40_1765, partial [Miltoncostaeaceae bacterium]|nr:hypothetical protein [Miltoncostaeaceae bacterium]
MTARAVGEALRRALASGSYVEFAQLYAPDACLDASLRGGRHRVRGPAAIAAALAGWWGEPAELSEWRVRLHPAGLELWAQWTSSAGASRT